MDFPQLVVIVAVAILALKLFKASAKVIIAAVAIAAVIYAVLYILPQYV